MASPTQRTMKVLKEDGYIPWIVEKWQRFGRGGQGVRQDLFGFCDIHAVHPDKGIGYFQVTGTGIPDHVRKVLGCAEVITELMKFGAHVQVWGWRKIKKRRGGKQMIWKPRIIHIHLNKTGNAIYAVENEKPYNPTGLSGGL